MTPEPALFTLPAPPIPHPQGGWLPSWLTEQILANPQPRFRTSAIWTRCPMCAAIILTGIDDAVIGQNASIDPTPLDPVAELVCALEHRPTYRLHLMGTTGRIQTRDQWNNRHPAGSPHKPPIVPAHRCGHQFPTFATPAERTHHGSHRTDRPPF